MEARAEDPPSPALPAEGREPDEREIGSAPRSGPIATGSADGAELSLAAGVSRLLVSLLFGIGPTDPLTFAGSAVLFCLIGLIACYIPARRATAVDAMEALRYE